MTEARIECLCPSFHIGDLNLRMRKGDIAWVSEEVARSSDDLRLAVRSGAASVVYARRCSVSRSPPPPNVRLNRTQRSGFVRTPDPRLQAERPETVAPVSQGIDPKALEDAIANGVAKAIQSLMSSGAFVPGNGGGAPFTGGTVLASAPVVTSDPVYIPSNLVPADSSTTITIAETSTGGADLDEASAALKATRKRKTTSTETA